MRNRDLNVVTTVRADVLTERMLKTERGKVYFAGQLMKTTF